MRYLLNDSLKLNLLQLEVSFILKIANKWRQEKMSNAELRTLLIVLEMGVIHLIIKTMKSYLLHCVSLLLFSSESNPRPFPTETEVAPIFKVSFCRKISETFCSVKQERHPTQS